MLSSVPISKYAGIAIVLIAAGFGFPIPEEIPIVTAGAMVGHDSQSEVEDDLNGALGGGALAYLTPQPSGLTRWWIMLPVCILSVVIGDATLYAIGRFGGTRLLNNAWVQRHVLPGERQIKITENFHKNGILILLGARLTPGIRSPVFLMAGILRMPWQKFLFADMLYAIPGVSILFGLAYVFTDAFVEAIKKAESHKPLVMAIVFALVGGFVIYKVFAARTTSTGDLRDIPDVARPVAAVTNAVEKAAEKAGHAAGKAIEKVKHPRHGHTPDPEPAAESPGG